MTNLLFLFNFCFVTNYLNEKLSVFFGYPGMQLCGYAPSWEVLSLIKMRRPKGTVQECRSTKVPKMKNCSTVPKVDDFRHCWTIKIIFGMVVLRNCCAALSRSFQQCRSTRVPNINFLFNSAENHLNFRHCWILFQFRHCCTSALMNAPVLSVWEGSHAWRTEMLEKFQPIKIAKRFYWLKAFLTKSKSILTKNVLSQ